MWRQEPGCTCRAHVILALLLPIIFYLQKEGLETLLGKNYIPTVYCGMLLHETKLVS
jgi:hypothetical protein